MIFSLCKLYIEIPLFSLFNETFRLIKNTKLNEKTWTKNKMKMLNFKYSFVRSIFLTICITLSLLHNVNGLPGNEMYRRRVLSDNLFAKDQMGKGNLCKI